MLEFYPVLVYKNLFVVNFILFYRVSHDLLVGSHQFLVGSQIFFWCVPAIFGRFPDFFGSIVLISNWTIPKNYVNEPKMYGIR